MGKNITERLAENSIRYYLLKSYAAILSKLFYKKIFVFGKHNIPRGYPIIFAPNHENAVMDPLAVLFTSKANIVFLARADVFKGKRMINFLTFIKILPVYRQRDGVENLEKNNEVFDITVDLLKRHKPICLMAEGKHGDKHSLQPLVKGIFRIAFSAQEQLTDKSKGVKIVPVGLYYHDYVKFNHSMVINYREPISVEDYIDLYKEKPALAINKLKDDLAARMSEGMIDIQNKEYYDTINFIQHEYPKSLKYKGSRNEKGHNYFLVQQKLVDKMEKALQNNFLCMPQLKHFTTEYTNLLLKHQLRDWVILKGKPRLTNILFNLLILIAGMPLFIYGFLANWFHFNIHKTITKNIKDLQFHSSVKFVLSMFVFLPYFIVTGVVIGLIFKSFLIALLYAILSPVCGFIALQLYYIYKKTLAIIKFRSLLNRKDADAIQMLLLRKKIFDIVDYIYNENTK